MLGSRIASILTHGWGYRCFESRNGKALARVRNVIDFKSKTRFPDVLKHKNRPDAGRPRKAEPARRVGRSRVGVAIGNTGASATRSAVTIPRRNSGRCGSRTPADYDNTLEPHARGSILVAAVFEAFLTIYKGRVTDLLRIATGGTGKLPDGQLHPDPGESAGRRGGENRVPRAGTCASGLLDFCPPVDIRFGDYLRGIITADCEMVKEDRHRYRLAFIDAFRRRGI